MAFLVAIARPDLVRSLVLVGGGDDEMTLSHTCTLYESLPAGRLADLGPPQTLMPRRRARSG